jgi:REP-associated tyrosine transposase
MPVKPNFNPDFLYFITTNAVNHFPLFQPDSAKRIILDSFHFLRTSGRMELFVFVVMPNHIHIIAPFSQSYKPADAMRDFKRYTARLILREFQAKGDEKILLMLREANQHHRQEYKIWEDDYDARDVFSPEFLQQKMDYIHMNPCQLQWHLVEDPADYLWSSAGFYMADRTPIIPVDDVRELFL